MKERQVLVAGLILVVLTLVAIFLLDGFVAIQLEPHQTASERVTGPFVSALEVVFGFGLSKFATGAAIMLAAVVLFAFRGRRAVAWLLLFVGLTQFTTRLVAGVLKNVFERLRPHEALRGGWNDAFFVDGGSSFPSGHAAHFWGLFFALALAFPKLRIPALLLAAAVSAARVAVNDHYLGDVVASAAIAALVTCAYAPWMLRKAERARAVPS